MEAADHIQIDASFEGGVNDLLDVLNTKPIADAVNDFADEWDGAGEVFSKLALKFRWTRAVHPSRFERKVQSKRQPAHARF